PVAYSTGQSVHEKNGAPPANPVPTPQTDRQIPWNTTRFALPDKRRVAQWAAAHSASASRISLHPRSDSSTSASEIGSNDPEWTDVRPRCRASRILRPRHAQFHTENRIHSRASLRPQTSDHAASAWPNSVPGSHPEADALAR